MAETAMFTLVEFLLARIAEDEADARRAAKKDDGNGLWVVTGLDSPVGVDYRPSRILAECESKRLLVDGLVDAFGDSDEVGGLRALALPYSDHPDYRDEWRS